MSEILGPISSRQVGGVSPTEMLYLDLTDELDGDNLTGTPTIATDETGLTFSSVAIISSPVTYNSTTIAANKGVEFRVTVTVEMRKVVKCRLWYASDASNKESEAFYIDVRVDR